MFNARWYEVIKILTLTASLRAASAWDRSRASAWCILMACSAWPPDWTFCCCCPVEPWALPVMSPLLPIRIAAAREATSTGERFGDTEFCRPGQRKKPLDNFMFPPFLCAYGVFMVLTDCLNRSSHYGHTLLLWLHFIVILLRWTWLATCSQHLTQFIATWSRWRHVVIIVGVVVVQ